MGPVAIPADSFFNNQKYDQTAFFNIDFPTYSGNERYMVGQYEEESQGSLRTLRGYRILNGKADSLSADPSQGDDFKYHYSVADKILKYVDFLDKSFTTMERKFQKQNQNKNEDESNV